MINLLIVFMVEGFAQTISSQKTCLIKDAKKSLENNMG